MFAFKLLLSCNIVFYIIFCDYVTIYNFSSTTIPSHTKDEQITIMSLLVRSITFE